MKLQGLMEDARKSSFKMGVLNFVLGRAIPFNKPHGFRVVAIEDHSIKVRIPFKRKNQNHLRGLHACCLATAAEFCSGLLLLYKLDDKKYRLIMKTLEMDYRYQGKMEAIAEFKLHPDQLEKEVIEPLKTEDKVLLKCEVEVKDREGNVLCVGYPTWQLKRWDKVRTKK